MTTPKKDAAVAPMQAPMRLDELWDTTLAWFSVHAVQILLAASAGVAIYIVLAALREFGKRFRSDRFGYGAVVGNAVAKTTHFFMVMVSARLVASYANPPEIVLRTVMLLFTVAAVFQAAIWAREIIIGFIERRTGGDVHNDSLANAMGIIRILVSVALFAIATVVVLDNLGVNVSGLVAGLGIGGIAIGLAAQGIFSDLFAALSIIFDRPFRRGEIITYDTTTARVERIGLKSTRLRAMSGEGKVISNANLLQKEITSLQTLERRRVKFALRVIYQTPHAVAARIPDMLRDVVEGEGMTFINAGLVAFGASSLDFEMEFDVPDPDTNDFFMMRHKVGLAILKRFNDEGIEFAYPTQMSFTASPDGRAVMPYPEEASVRDGDVGAKGGA